MNEEERKGYFIEPPPDADYLKWVRLMKDRPTVPGKALRYEFLPPRGYWGGLLKKGQVIRVIDLEGNQCFDTIMYDAKSIYNRLNTCYTTIIEGKWDNWKRGDGIWSRLMNKLAMITEDTSEGHHAFVGAFCSEGFDRVADGMPNMHSCHDNFISAMRMAGFPEFSAKDMDWGSCISVFMNLFYKPDGSIEMRPVTNNPGDYIDFMAERDIIVTLSNCPYETANCNNWRSSAMYAVVFDPDDDYVAKANELRKEKEAQYQEFLGYTEEEWKTFLIRD
jgi:uncharacterized protein YcgI (DUF1989 family)